MALLEERISVVNGGSPGVVKDTVKSIEAGLWHSHDVGSEEHIVERLADHVLVEASFGEIEQMF